MDFTVPKPSPPPPPLSFCRTLFVRNTPIFLPLCIFGASSTFSVAFFRFYWLNLSYYVVMMINFTHHIFGLAFTDKESDKKGEWNWDDESEKCTAHVRAYTLKVAWNAKRDFVMFGESNSVVVDVFFVCVLLAFVSFCSSALCTLVLPLFWLVLCVGYWRWWWWRWWH